MKQYCFPHVFIFGKWDEVDAEIEVELSDEESARLESAAKGESNECFSDNVALADIYDKVYAAIIGNEREGLLSDPTPVENMLSWDDDYDPNQPITDEQIERYLDELYIKIYYPNELCE